MKCIAILLAAMMMLSLCACTGGAASDQAAKPGNNITGKPNHTDTPNNSVDPPAGNNNTLPGTNDRPAEGDASDLPDVPEDIIDRPAENEDPVDPEKPGDEVVTRRFIYNGNHYEVTDEKLDEGDVGIELFSIMNIVTDMPAEEGDAVGLDKGTRVFRLQDDNEYDEIAVEIGGVYYKAIQRD